MWQQTAPEKAGFAPDLADRLDALIREGRAPGLHGVVVARHGDLVLEHYGSGPDFALNVPLGTVDFGPETLHDVRSITKSVVGLLYGIALGGGLVPDPGEPILRHFPEYADLAADPRRTRLTVEHALTMTLGLEWDESAPYTGPENSEIAMEMAEDRHRFVLDRPIVEEPGTRWNYNGGAAALVGGLIARGTGRPLEEFARAALFEPLGITSFAWATGDDGAALAASGLRLTPRDLAATGQAVLDRRVVPAAWIEEMLRPHVPTGKDSFYGYLWYAGPDGRAAATGNGGQRLFLRPDLGLVVAVTAGGYNRPDQDGTPRAVLEEVVVPALAP
ncbi:serine hydrolase domain-containing protein [Planomonospora venezuelensis]|uniref:CubicO group peptidase (Beta-lactamase class C family) n=1 Tax=Planomonospora venezuelensis TaxID=1999 RepID=A0A841D8L0_PLAVE|nr:serine hydrolase domain-containing protein [Planomonospora venezuelensis]MBB5964658.1 CubicO group peptidase (beta-lactamase class C family) [Planomonospora venezuelensis]GIN03066.1 6-aminohexanoate-dimer hydrolase [Planomonospora venezuelensis]